MSDLIYLMFANAADTETNQTHTETMGPPAPHDDTVKRIPSAYETEASKTESSACPSGHIKIIEGQKYCLSSPADGVEFNLIL